MSDPKSDADDAVDALAQAHGLSRADVARAAAVFDAAELDRPARIRAIGEELDARFKKLTDPPGRPWWLR
ncbi:MAG: hypothetical protein HOW73_43575 [Polyangiaceae bacterium]|nr:hypothetical protein [Polyangiaceae bacterium]